MLTSRCEAHSGTATEGQSGQGHDGHAQISWCTGLRPAVSPASQQLATLWLDEPVRAADAWACGLFVCRGEAPSCAWSSPTAGRHQALWASTWTEDVSHHCSTSRAYDFRI